MKFSLMISNQSTPQSTGGVAMRCGEMGVAQPDAVAEIRQAEARLAARHDSTYGARQ